MSADFWWITSEQQSQYDLVLLGHHRPLSDEEIPFTIPWSRSLVNGRLSQQEQWCPVDFVETWRAACDNKNVYRSLTLRSSVEERVRLLGPFLVDIDNSQDSGDGYLEDLEDALLVTRRVTSLLTDNWHIRQADLRVFFSGRKGFNLEIRPHALGITGDCSEQVQLSFARLNELTQSLTGKRSYNAVSAAGTVIDPVYGTRGSGPYLKHPFVRLTGSINLWQSSAGENGRRRVQVSLNEINTTAIDSFLEKASV